MKIDYKSKGADLFDKLTFLTMLLLSVGCIGLVLFLTVIGLGTIMNWVMP